MTDDTLKRADAVAFDFDVFISYRRSDGTKSARSLRKKLQHYDIHRRLKHMKRTRLKVFLDTVYERGASDFYERNIQPALLSSRMLVVLATPHAISRKGSDDWIQREITDFRDHRGSENILVVRAAGDFLSELPGDLSKTAPNIQIIDMRNDGTWSKLSPLRSSRIADEWIKLVAPLFDVSVRDMPRLRREQERAQQRAISVAAGAVVGAGAFAATLSWYALTQQRVAQRTLDNSLFAVSRVIQTASTLELPPDDASAKRSMLMTACDLFDNLANIQARDEFGLTVLSCDIDRVRAFADLKDYALARSQLGRLSSVVQAKYAEEKSDEWAGAVANILALALEIELEPLADDSPEIVPIIRDNTEKFGALLKAHPVEFLAGGYAWRVEILSYELENRGDFMASALLAQTAANIFEVMSETKRATSGREEEEDELKRQNRGRSEAIKSYKNLAWLRSNKLGDQEASLKACASAFGLLEPMLLLAEKGSQQYAALLHEKGQIEGIQAAALAAAQRYSEAKQSYERGLAINGELIAFETDDGAREALQKENAALKDELAQLVIAHQGSP